MISHRESDCLQRSLLREAGILLLIAICVTSACQGSDPLERTPPDKFPTFAAKLPAADYETRFARAGKSFRIAEQDATTKLPVTGLRFVDVKDGGPAHQLGIRVNDIANRMDGDLLWMHENLPYVHQERLLVFYSVASKRLKSVTLPAGKIGVRFEDHWRPELAYLRSKSRDPKWDQMAYVGIVSAAMDPDLAETAWHRAFAAGYQPDAHAAAAGMEIALARGDIELSRQFAHFAWEADNKLGEVVHPLLLYRAAAASFDLRQMLRVTESFPTALSAQSAEIQALIEVHMRRPQAERDLPAPHQLVEKFVRDDLLPRLRGYRVSTLERELAIIQRKEPITLSAEPAYFQEFAVAPPQPIQNLEISFKFTWEPSPGNDGGFLKQLEIEFQDGRHDPEMHPDNFGIKRTQLAFAMHESGASFQHYPLSETIKYRDPAIKTGANSVHEFRLFKVGGQGELFLDGRRLMYLPLDQMANVPWFYIRSIGSKTVIHDFQFNELLENALED